MLKPKQCVLLCVCCFLFSIISAQDLKWMTGTWKGTGNKHKNQPVKTLDINSINGNAFKGTKTFEINDRNRANIITSISGYLSNKTFYLQTDSVLHQTKPQHGDWFDCTVCKPVNRIEITYDSIFLSSEIIGCAAYCDGISVYYKLLPDFDTTTQRALINEFGTPEQIAAFKPHVKEVPPMVSSDPDEVKPKINQDSINNSAKLAKKKQQQVNDSLKVVAANEKKREQYILDSINILKQQKQQHILDSLNDATVAAKKRQQGIDDSTINANKIAKKRQQQIDDSLKIAAVLEKKRLQQIHDSLDIVKQQQQQHTQDSITNAAIAFNKRQQQIFDSTNAANAFNKKRQQQIDDSLKLAAALEKKRLQHIQDSLDVVKQQRQQHIQDSITNAAIAVKKRQQEIEDSTNAANVLAKKRQQQIDDSLKIVTALEKKRQQHMQDSLNIVKQKQEQHIQDSLQNAAVIAKKRQQQIADSINNATMFSKKKEQQLQDSINKSNAAAKIKQQETQDSIKIAATKQHIADSLKTITTKSNDKSKALTQRDNVLLQTYHISTPDILVELFDNAEIDGDRVSVYHNNEIIVNNQTLTHEPITFKVHADAANRTHEFVLIAENLGTIPPNTALMRITVGTQVYKLSVKTDLKTNAKIDFFYDGN